MDITLTTSELAMLTDSKVDLETVEDVIHRLLAPNVRSHAETRLRKLSELYKGLSPEDQLEAVAVLKAWQASKLNP